MENEKKRGNFERIFENKTTTILTTKNKRHLYVTSLKEYVAQLLEFLDVEHH